MPKKRVDMLRFSSSGGFNSADLELENVLRLPGAAGLTGRTGSRGSNGGSPPAISLSTSANFNEESEKHQAKIRELNDHSRPLVPASTSINFLPVSDIVWSYHGSCFKGNSTINPYKRNQDAHVMELDDATDTLLLAVFDGHGQHGDRCASWYQHTVSSKLKVTPLF
jgi:hypothetical protein